MDTGLAYVGRIELIDPIPDADKIESAEVVCGEGGRWRGVVKKGDFAPGDTCTVYLQDAVVKPSEELAFLERSKWRVKMARFRGAPSECVIVAGGDGYSIGDDVTQILGVTKYERQVSGHVGGNPRGNFPAFIPKTDEPNFQGARRLLYALKGKPWYATEKADGMSSTAYRLGDHFGICSRNLELKPESGGAIATVAKEWNLEDKLPEGIAIQWETVGPGIQKNPMGLSKVEGRLFSAYNIPERRYLHRWELNVLSAILNVSEVAFVSSGDSFDLDDESLRKLAEGTYPNGKQREGIVIRPFKEETVRMQRLSFKVLNLLYKDG